MNAAWHFANKKGARTIVPRPLFVLLGRFGLDYILTGELMTQFSFVGYAIIMAIGLNFILPEKIKTANMLPSMFVPIVWYYLVMLFNLIF